MPITGTNGEVIKESWITAYYELIWDEADSYFTEEVVGEWHENMSLYHNVNYRANKLSWQADIQEPVTADLVSKLSNFFTRSLVSDSTSDNPFFKFNIPNNKAKAKAYTELANSVLEANKYSRVIFNESLKKALATSLYCDKVLPVTETITMPVQIADGDEGALKLASKQITRSRTVIKSINPFDMRLDPHGNRYIIEIERASVPEILTMAQKGKWFNVETALKKGAEDTQEDTGEKQESDTMNTRKLTTIDRGVLHHVHAKFLTVNDEGRHLPEVKDNDIYFIMLNGILIHYTHNLLPKGRYPYVCDQPFKHIVGRYGKGYISMLKSVICEYLNALSLTVDSFTINVLPVYERDMDNTNSESADVNASEIVPGRVYESRGGRMLTQVSNTNPAQFGLQMTFYFDRLLQNRSSQSEFFTGAPTSKGRPTLGEIETKTARNDSFIADLANEIESRIIENELELVLMTELIYLDDPDRPKLEEILNSEASVSILQNLSFEERMKDLIALNVTARGISQRIERQESFGSLVQILQVLGNFGELGFQKISIDKMVEFLFRIKNVPIEEIIKSEEGEDKVTVPGTEPTALASPAEPNGSVVPGGAGGAEGTGTPPV